MFTKLYSHFSHFIFVLLPYLILISMINIFYISFLLLYYWGLQK